MMASRREAVRAELEAARSRAIMAAGMAPAHVLGKNQEQQSRGQTPPSSVSLPQLPRGVQAFHSSDGLLLLRGRDAKGNLAALKMGRPDDLWLHTEGSAGAHVIIRRAGSQPISEQTLQEAGVLAALKSPYKDAGTAMVQCALVKHVHPMRGASLGTVRIDRHEPGLTVKIDPELESRLVL